VPITITIPARELFDPLTNRFITTESKTLSFEHSLLSIAKWESKWHKPYMSKERRTDEETRDYIRCMCLTDRVDPNIFYALDQESFNKISEYILDSQTATTFKKKDDKPSREIITNELVYYWMTELGIPFDPCQKWHFNRLMTLIRVASIKKQPPKKLGRKGQRDAINRISAENARRKALYNTRG
jgi:hypothetical protein